MKALATYRSKKRLVGLLAVWCLVLTSLNTYFLLNRGPVVFPTADIEYTYYNNYLIFEGSARHLLDGENLYCSHVPEHHDYYKYSPTFAVGMIPFTAMPVWLGLSLWNLVNLLAVFIPLVLIVRPGNWKQWLLPFVLVTIEAVTSIQSSQSNGLLIGSILGAWLLLERGRPSMAVLLVLLGGFIKIYSLIGLVVFLFYPGKVRNMIYGLLGGAVLFILPALLVGWDQLIWQYKNWYHMLQMDYQASVGMSILGVLDSWFGLAQLKYPLLLGGVMMLAVPFYFNRDLGDRRFQLDMLAFILLWVVLFNHKAESPTYILAVAGVALWYLQHPDKVWHQILVWLVLFFTVLASTDVYPKWMRDEWFEPYHIKAVPCILVLGTLFYQMVTSSSSDKSLSRVAQER